MIQVFAILAMLATAYYLAGISGVIIITLIMALAIATERGR